MKNDLINQKKKKKSNLRKVNKPLKVLTKINKPKTTLQPRVNRKLLK